MNWLPKSTHFEVRKSHYVKGYIKSGKLFLKSTDDCEFLLKGIGQVYYQFLKDEQPECVEYLDYKTAYHNHLITNI